MQLLDAYLQATRTILDEPMTDPGQANALYGLMKHALGSFKHSYSTPDQKTLDLVLVSSLEKRSECLDTADRIIIVHDKSLARDMQILNKAYEPGQEDDIVFRYVCRAVLHEALSAGYLNLAYQVLLDGRGYDIAFERSLPLCPVTFLHEIYTLYHEVGHYMIARSDFIRDAFASMVDMMRHQKYFDHAKTHLAKGEQAAYYADLIDHDSDLHEEIFCDHFAYRYGFFWLKHGAPMVNLPLDYRLHPPLMSMFHSHLFLLEQVRFGFRLAIAHHRGESSDEVMREMDASLARYHIRHFYVTMMDAGVFEAGPFDLDEARAMRPFSAGMSKRVQNVQATQFSQVAIQVAQRVLLYFSFDPLECIAPHGPLDRKFADTLESFGYRERIIGLLRSGPEALREEYASLFR